MILYEVEDVMIGDYYAEDAFDEKTGGFYKELLPEEIVKRLHTERQWALLGYEVNKEARPYTLEFGSRSSFVYYLDTDVHKMPPDEKLCVLCVNYGKHAFCFELRRKVLWNMRCDSFRKRGTINGWANLGGYKDDVRWAEKIRKDIMDSLAPHMEGNPELQERVKYYLSRELAGWWIANRKQDFLHGFKEN